jgi:sugar-phosphatase
LDRRKELCAIVIEAVIFDMDGLLIDSEPLWGIVETAVLTSVGVPIAAMQPGLTTGLRVDEIVEYWHRRYPWQTPAQKEVEARIAGGVLDLIRKQGTPMPGAREAVAMLAAAGVPLAVASSSSSEMIDVVMERLVLRSCFEVLQSAEHEPYGKPHPGVYIETARRLGVDPARCLALEDSPNGVIAAKAAKMTCIAVPQPTNRDDGRLRAADEVLTSLYEFGLDILERLAPA